MPAQLVKVLRRNLKSALKKGRIKEAAPILEHLKTEDPLGFETRGLTLEFLIKAQRLDEAEPLAKQLLRLFPASSRIHYLAGLCYYRLKRYDRAGPFFRESYRLYNHWQSRYWLAKTLTQRGKAGDFEEAQSILEEVRKGFPMAVRDLAWLFERKKDWENALRLRQEELAIKPDDEETKRQITRLKAKLLDPESLVEEMENLAEHGESVPQHLLPELVEDLFATGQGEKARATVIESLPELPARLAVQLGWVCNRAQAFDLVTQIFKEHVQENLNSYPFLNALENAAKKTNQAESVIEVYQGLAATHPALFGRIKKLAAAVEES